MNDITYVGKHTVIYTVSRHAHESWEFIYCTSGSGAFRFDDRILEYREGDVVVIPPMVPHSNASADGFQNIHINMVSPALSFTAPLVISDVLQQVRFQLDEEGTRAAAATEVVMVEGAAAPDDSAPEPIAFNCDRPFIAAVVDRSTGAILFVGAVVDPAA